MTNDPLGDIVTMARARCTFSTGLVAGNPWSLRYPPPRQIKFMAVVKGACWLRVDGEETPHRIATGDVLMLSGPRPYTLASDLDVPPLDAVKVFADPTAKLVTLGDGDDFVVIGGHVALDPGRGWMLADVLSPLLHIDGSLPEASTLRFFLDQLVKEVASDQPGAGLMSEQLAQLLFVQTMRVSLTTSGPFAPGWIKALGDERIAPALRLMHREPARPWRLHELAGIVAMSRTSFAVRFKEAAGVAPLAYLSNWRMHIAERTLRETTTPVATLALSLGYTSESAFSNAFKRATGLAPSRYRDHIYSPCLSRSPIMADRQMKSPGPDHPITIETNPHRVVVTLGGQVLADTRHALTLREAKYPAVQYIPRADVDMTRLSRTEHSTYCPFKGDCSYYSLPGGGDLATNAVWSYEAPYPAVEPIRGHLAFYPDRVVITETE